MWKARLPMILLAVILSAIVYNFATIKPEGAQMQDPNDMHAAPDFSLKRPDGEPPFTKDSLKGKVIVLDFWATWCGPCRESIPELAHIAEKYKDKGLQVNGIAVDDTRTRDQVPAAIKGLGINYPVVFGLDSPSIVKDYPAPSIPMMYIIDKKGNLRDQMMGYKPGSRWDERIDVLLNE